MPISTRCCSGIPSAGSAERQVPCRNS
uniref:Uncharacterized protein n=1 Tax=Arundo donax TaxID=35708 RepID=A0A0A9C2R6_ARUDO